MLCLEIYYVAITHMCKNVSISSSHAYTALLAFPFSILLMNNLRVHLGWEWDCDILQVCCLCCHLCVQLRRVCVPQVQFTVLF